MKKAGTINERHSPFFFVVFSNQFCYLMLSITVTPFNPATQPGRKQTKRSLFMICHEVDYTIIGNDMQIVEVELDPNESVIAEAGAMNYMDSGITFEAKMGDGSVLGGIGRLLDGK